MKKLNKKEICYNIINSALAGVLVFLGSLTSGEITAKGLAAALIASLVVAITQFKNYWDGEKGEYCSHLFSFVNI